MFQKCARSSEACGRADGTASTHGVGRPLCLCVVKVCEAVALTFSTDSTSGTECAECTSTDGSAGAVGTDGSFCTLSWCVLKVCDGVAITPVMAVAVLGSPARLDAVAVAAREVYGIHG
jgi:hypothetical protein